MSESDVASNAAPATRPGSSVSLEFDADTQLGLRGTRVAIRTVADFLVHAAKLSHKDRESAAHRLGIGRPRSAPIGRAVTAYDLGIATDPETGKTLAPDTYGDTDCDPELYDKSPDQMVEILRRRDEYGSNVVTERTLQREVKIKINGGHGSGGRKAKKKPKPSSAVDRARWSF